MTGGVRKALLISGGVNHKLNHPRYGNDITKWCSELLGRGFHCVIFYTDGSNPLLSSVDVRPATREQILAEFADLETLDSNDVVLVLVTNHGDQSGFCLWGGDLFTPKELTAALAPCQAIKVVIMGQCFGGIFSTMGLERVIVITASGANEVSYACAEPPGPGGYDEFLYQFALTLFGSPSEISGIGPTPTLRAAFEQARGRDRRPESPSITDKAGLAALLTL